MCDMKICSTTAIEWEVENSEKAEKVTRDFREGYQGDPCQKERSHHLDLSTSSNLPTYVGDSIISLTQPIHLQLTTKETAMQSALVAVQKQSALVAVQKQSALVAVQKQCPCGKGTIFCPYATDHRDCKLHRGLSSAQPELQSIASFQLPRIGHCDLKPGAMVAFSGHGPESRLPHAFSLRRRAFPKQFAPAMKETDAVMDR